MGRQAEAVRLAAVGMVLWTACAPVGALAQAPDPVAQPASGPAANAPAAPADGSATPASAAAIPVPVATPPPPESSAGSSTQLSEVVVTATKREKSVRSIPENITAISGTELEQRNAQGLEDIAKLVPGVNVETADSQPTRVTINGITGQAYTGFTVGILFGDVSFTDAYVPLVSLDPQPFDLKTVEILKGPQGTLFGASALNGAVRYVPNDARLEHFEARYFAQYSNYSGSEFKPMYGGAINIPIGDSLAFRLTGFERETPGYITPVSIGIKDSNHINQGGLRGQIQWLPLDALDVKLTYAWQNTHFADANSSNRGDDSLTDTARKQLSPQKTEYNLLDLNASYAFSWARFVSESAVVRKQAYQFDDASFTLPTDLPILALVSRGFSNTLSQEFRLVSPNDPKSNWQWVAGVYVSQQKTAEHIDIPIGNAALPISTVEPVVTTLFPQLDPFFAGTNYIEGEANNTRVTIREEALFGDVTRKFWNQLELTLGGRLYVTDSGGTNDLYGALITASSGMTDERNAADIREKAFNPHGSLLWHLNPNIITYINVAKGFRPGGVQPGSPGLPTDVIPPTFHSDTIWDYETGIRTTWFHKTLFFDVAGFYERWKDPQYHQNNQSGLLSYLTNVGGVKSEGGSVAIQWLTPLKGLMLSATGGYSRAVTTKAYEFSGSTAPVGTPWVYAPRFQTAETISYNFALGPIGVQTQVTHTYLSHAINDLVQQLQVLGTNQYDANLAISDLQLKWLPEISINVKNATNDHAYSIRQILGTGPYMTSEYEYVTPRAIFLRVSGHF